MTRIESGPGSGFETVRGVSVGAGEALDSSVNERTEDLLRDYRIINPLIEGKKYLEERSELDPILRGHVSEVRAVDIDSEQPADYLALLRDPRNCFHFTGIYKKMPDGKMITLRLRKFRSYLNSPEVHAIVGLNIYRERLGYAAIVDSSEGQHDNWIERFIIVNELQGKGKTVKTGKSFLKCILRNAFDTEDFLGRKRDKMDAAVVMGVPGWERAANLFLNPPFKFEPKQILQDQADVYIPPGISYPGEADEIAQTGRMVTKHTMRFEIDKDRWRYYEAKIDTGKLTDR